MYNKNTMRKLLTIVGLITVFTSCTPQEQLISPNPLSTRKAMVYENKVVIVTKTTISREHFEELIAIREGKKGID
jgi:hypothetical protein